jgi:ribonuclease HII
LEADRREVLAERIRERAIAWSVAAVDAATIDCINIYQASKMAMRMAIGSLPVTPDFLLTDAMPLDLAIPQRPLIKGDARCHAIAAASILAKVERDRCMCVWDKVFPAYGLAGNKGYGTPDHLKALAGTGATPLHRLSFEPVRSVALFPVEANPWAEQQLGLFAEAEAVCL